ncbi:MAG TPA: glucosyl-3-phosphoglycerate synthase [Jatrophihabitans sp.]|nr:glucosyl-3-phosphoglycerate synthase [Jatrophihabitans sp.]
MHSAAQAWFGTHTHAAADFPAAGLAVAKAAAGSRVSVVIPARDEAGTVAGVVGQIADALVPAGLVDELVVIDSDSADDTAARARAAGATVYAAREIETGQPPVPGKGEALWKSLFVTTGDLLVFIDADLTDWGPHFVTGLLGPLLAGPGVQLVKGFYDRLADDLPGAAAAVPQGGRVTELCARPLLNLYWPELAAVVQPLAGEWAIRRALFESLPVPVGYGVEFATLTDTHRRHGLSAIAQVDLGRRGHRHQAVHDLGVMAAEILATAMRRLPGGLRPDEPAGMLSQYDRSGQHDRSSPDGWRHRVVPTLERPPAVRDAHYARRSEPGREVRCCG